MGYDPNIRDDESSFRFLTRNYRVLKKLLDANEDIPKAISNNNQYEIAEEVIFALHNYVSSVMSLVQHTRELNKKLYAITNPKALEEIQLEINNRFVNNETHQIIQGLRDYTQHRKLPVVGRVMSFKAINNAPNLETSYYLSTKSLLEWDGWKPIARKALENMISLTLEDQMLGNKSSNIKVNRLTTEHYNQMMEFYNWLFNKRREWMMKRRN